jgi:very-short-patch-repair endonuclease
MSNIVQLRPPHNGGFETLVDQVRYVAEERVTEVYEGARGESPIETLMFAAMYSAIQDTFCFEIASATSGYPVFVPGAEPCSLNRILIEQQIEICGFRADFVIHFWVWPAKTWKKLIVECDGHDFHERTKEQAKRDRSRDRLAQCQGIPILRFTGSEIWNDPLGCGYQVGEYLDGAARY